MENTKLSSRKYYLSKKSPGSKTNLPKDGLSSHLTKIDPNKEESEVGYNNFVVINDEIKSIDWLYLSSWGRRRLKIDIY